MIEGDVRGVQTCAGVTYVINGPWRNPYGDKQQQVLRLDVAGAAVEPKLIGQIDAPGRNQEYRETFCSGKDLGIFVATGNDDLLLGVFDIETGLTAWRPLTVADGATLPLTMSNSAQLGDGLFFVDQETSDLWRFDLSAGSVGRVANLGPAQGFRLTVARDHLVALNVDSSDVTIAWVSAAGVIDRTIKVSDVAPRLSDLNQSIDGFAVLTP